MDMFSLMNAVFVSAAKRFRCARVIPARWHNRQTKSNCPGLRRILCAFVVWFFSAVQLFGQSPPATNPAPANPTQGSNIATDLSSTPETAPSVGTADCSASYRCWARVDYLLWWVKNSPLPVPVVTTGDPRVGFSPTLAATVNTAGAIGQAGTGGLVGGNAVKLPPVSGLSLTLGGWVDD